jgi:L-iditol 2-dehydrogenase
VFVIGVGRNEQNVSRTMPLATCTFLIVLVQFPFMHLSVNEIDLQFQYRYAQQYPKAIRLVAGGLINLKPLVTHRFKLEDAVAAFHLAADPTKGAIKVQIQD